MSLAEMEAYIHTSKYANYIPHLKRRETWEESIDRVKAMHLRKYPHVADEIEEAFECSYAKLALGSQRALQFAGPPIDRHNSRLFNCAYSYCDRVRFFQEAFYLLLCGCGVGFSVQRKHIDCLPMIHPLTSDVPITHAIQDSIEGWADAEGALISSYMPWGPFPEYFSRPVIFDPSLVRPKGSPISSGTGLAPGPGPLLEALENIRRIFEREVSRGFPVKMRPIVAYDIVMHSSESVLSGGIRRSATIVLFSPDDEEMARAKTGSWMYENPQRARSNNSALLVRHQTSRAVFSRLMKWTREFGEPATVWADHEDAGYNPCVEASLYGYDQYGNSGWQMCNLAEINGRRVKTHQDFARAAKAASIIGTLQAGYTSFPYLGEVSERITRREALLGVSITGMMEHPQLFLNPDIQTEMAQLVIKTNEQFAPKIGVNPTARGTLIKPSGTAALLLGTSSGIHPHHAKRYIRAIQANEDENPAIYFHQVNPQAVEPSVWKSGDRILQFCVEIDDQAITKDTLNAIDLLDHVRLTQNHWVEHGTVRERCAQLYLKHNVSNTIQVRAHEWDEVEEYIYEHRGDFAGVSLIAETGDLDYPQPPFTAISTPAEIVAKYGDGSLMVSGLIVDGLHAYSDLWKACDAVLGRITPEGDLQTDWIRRARQFADRYFGGDILKTLYALKEVNNWKKWCDLRREYRSVDYTQMREVRDFTQHEGELACAGRQCEIPRRESTPWKSATQPG
jgi:hypothetical protein